MSLKKEIEIARADIRTDDYSMSIGEWVNLYENNEIDLHPEFQRFFRWTPFQKSRLIESILLGIPIPPIYVSQREDGIWDVVDGLQRLSTIFEFVGILMDEHGEKLPPLTLERTKYLPSLEGKKWIDESAPKQALDLDLRLYIKRSKISVSIILRESAEIAKYELFQRLNTGGTALSDQEVRNCILVMTEKEFYAWIRTLADYDDFRNSVDLTDRSLEEQYDVELVVRFLVLLALDEGELNKIGEVGEFLTDRIVELASDKNFDRAREEDRFKKTFNYIARTASSDTFRRYDVSKKRHLGGFLLSAYETIALGLGYNVFEGALNEDEFARRIRSIWSEDLFVKHSGSGVRASSRIPKLIPMGRKKFAS